VRPDLDHRSRSLAANNACALAWCQLYSHDKVVEIKLKRTLEHKDAQATMEIYFALTVCLLPMRVALILVTEAALAWFAPCVLRSGLKMALHLVAGFEAK
jgi:hypothetical protein